MDQQRTWRINSSWKTSGRLKADQTAGQAGLANRPPINQQVYVKHVFMQTHHTGQTLHGCLLCDMTYDSPHVSCPPRPFYLEY